MTTPTPKLANLESPSAVDKDGNVEIEPGEKQGNSSPAWLVGIGGDFQRLLRLPENWDSYGARSVDPLIVASALRILPEVVRSETPRPAILPTVRGGVQIEWHTRGIDLEIELTSPDEVDASYEDAHGVLEWQSRLDEAKPRLVNLIAALSPAAEPDRLPASSTTT